jgi:uncharacterized protein YjbJ (UPF0337 family)
MSSNSDQAKGRAKQAVGALTGDEDLKKEGRTDERAGKVKGSIQGIKDKADGFVDNVKNKLTKD